MDVCQRSQKNIIPKAAQKTSCRACYGRHPAVLYCVKLKKKGAHGNNASKERVEEIACTSINTGSDIISMCIALVQIRQGESGKVCQPYLILDSCSQGTFILDQLKKNPWHLWKTKIYYHQNEEYTSTLLAIEDLQVANIGNHTSE